MSACYSKTLDQAIKYSDLAKDIEKIKIRISTLENEIILLKKSAKSPLKPCSEVTFIPKLETENET